MRILREFRKLALDIWRRNDGYLVEHDAVTGLYKLDTKAPDMRGHKAAPGARRKACAHQPPGTH